MTVRPQQTKRSGVSNDVRPEAIFASSCPAAARLRRISGLAGAMHAHGEPLNTSLGAACIALTPSGDTNRPAERSRATRRTKPDGELLSANFLGNQERSHDQPWNKTHCKSFMTSHLLNRVRSAGPAVWDQSWHFKSTNSPSHTANTPGDGARGWSNLSSHHQVGDGQPLNESGLCTHDPGSAPRWTRYPTLRRALHLSGRKTGPTSPRPTLHPV